MDENESQLEKWCLLLGSTKVRARKEACIELTEHLRHKSTIDFLNNSDSDWWNRLLISIFQFMNEEHEKHVDDLRKKSKECSHSPPSADLFAFFVRIAVKEESSLDYLKLFHVIIEWLGDSSKKQFQHQLLKILTESLLINSKIRNSLEERDWVSLYFLLKKLCGEGSVLDNEQITCLALVVKLGPLSKFPVMVYRQQFDYIVKLCKMVTSKSQRPQQDAVLDIVYYFCKYTAKDSRMACCKLGEEIFYNLVDLYQRNENEDRIKTNLINFFLLQVAIHNPKGVQENHRAAYAASWDFWKNCLCSVYDLLSNEVDANLALTVKNRALFLVENDVTQLFGGFVKLFVEVCRQLFRGNIASVDEPPRKRPRTEFTNLTLINKMTETKSWPWINLTYSLIETYPDMITSDDYVTILQNLATLQSDCKEMDTLHHVHKALIVLLKSESLTGVEKSRIDGLWKGVGDATLRLLNQNNEDIQTLLQLLIINKYLTSHHQLIQYFRPGGALNIDEHNLKTLDVAFKTFTVLQFDKNLKKQVMHWILSTQSEHFNRSQVAEILICLVLKQWPNRHFAFTQIEKPFDDIESVYLDVCFESLLVDFENEEDKDDDVFCVDKSLLDYLMESLKKLIGGLDIRRNPEDYFNVCILVFNVVSSVHKYNLIESEVCDSTLFEMSTKNLFDNVFFKMAEIDEKCTSKLTKLARILVILFSAKISDFMSKRLRRFVPEQLIRDMFGILNTKDVPGDSFVTLKKCLVEVIVTFSCLPNPTSDIQQRAFQALVGFNYNCRNDDDYELVLTLMRSVKSCKPKTLSVKSLLSIFDVLQKFCEDRYYCSVSVIELLDFFCDIYPLVVASDSQDCKNDFVRILYPFYARRLHYEPSVSIRLLKCIGLVFELEPSAAYAKWSDEEIVLKIPEFLNSDYQEIRFCAIRTLASIFRVSSKLRLLEQYHKQEIIFSKISDLSLKVLEIEDNVDQNRIIDEVVARSSSILHTFASIMLASNLWIEEALFTLLKIICDKNLGLSLVEIVIDIVAKKLGFKSGSKFLEKYLVGLVNRWKPYNFTDFPFRIFRCSSKIDLFSKYWALLAHIFVANSENSLNQVASTLSKSLQKLIEEICPKLLSYCIGQEVSDFSSITNNKIYQLLFDTLGVEKSQEIFKNNIEEIILCLTDFISDEKVFEQSFGRSIIFPMVTEVRLTVSEFQDCLQFIETSLYDDQSVIATLIQTTPEKIHFMLLQLNLRVYGVQALEDKLRYLHLYSLIASLCIENVLSEPSMQPYLIRDLTHTLLHHIKNHKNQPELSEMSCIFFKKFLRKTLPSLSTVLSHFFLTIISRLKYVALENCAVSALCLDMLELLIVEHKNLFVTEISKLDSIPETRHFDKIFSVHRSLKYSRKVTLEDEIVQFLDFSQNTESLDECEHSITHLKKVIISKKDELRDMYSQLRQSRGFSEDCKNSNLHKLIRVLITLSCSNNMSVSTEAAKCLGEIGPADLATLILQPEKDIADPKWAPFELMLGCAISLLLKYLVDADVTVIKASSMALFQILSTKESRKIIKSNDDFGFGAINSTYLTPFCAIDVRTANFKVVMNGDYFRKTIQDDTLWIPDDGCHETWVTRLVCAFLASFEERAFFNGFIEVCKLKVEFCELVLPLVVYTVLFLNNFAFTTMISNQIEIFFNKHWEITVRNQKGVNITTNKSSVQTMLNVVHFVRLQRSVRKKEIKDMKLDYLRVAKAAHFCTAYFTALLYAELWCQEQINQSANENALSTCSYTKLDLIYEKVDGVTGNALQNILRQAYKCVGETDALLGCGTSHLLSPASRVDHYKELGRWDQVTQYYERQVSLGRNVSLPPLVDSLKNANLYQLSLFCPSDEPNYESLWRLGHWSHRTSDLSHNTYDKCKFHALKALHKCEDFTFKKAMDEGRIRVVEDFMAANMESIKNFYHTFAKLQCLKEIEEFAETTKTEGVLELLHKWKVQDDVVCNDYQYVEPVQAQRILLFTDFLKKQPDSNLRDVIVDTVLSYAQCARIEGNSHVAFRILENLRVLTPTNDMDAKIKLEEAQLCWSIQDVLTAKCILRQLCTSENVNPRVHALALKLTGTWMVESSSENRQTIIENYFQKSLSLIKRDNDKTDEDEKSIVDTFDQLAKFADHEYQEVMSHIKSDVFQKKKENMVKSRDLVNSINIGLKKTPTRDLQKALMIKRKLSCIDEIEIHNTKTDKNNLLLLALKYYLRILIRSDNHNMTIFRLFSLLLENRDNELVKTVLEKDLLKIPTYKFINILPQIIPHISNTSTDIFSQTVNNLIEKCAKDHPYHTLPLILALALSNKDREYSSESKAAVNDTRTQTAKAILKKLKTDQKLSSLIDKMEFVSEAVIELAYHQSVGDKSSYKVPTNSKIRKVQNWGEILLPTYILPVDKSCTYEHVIGIHKFNDVYHNVGGINAPKRITCIGSDGVTRSQLIKGQDDLRQDAVMQQVFTIMNSLLTVNKQTKNLQIRTYKIVPLSMRSGILEWVENTMPIGHYLTGEKSEGGAHVKFRPMDRKPNSCRVDLKNASSKSNEERTRAFNKICSSIKPVFHKFFETSFPQPTVWYERRRTYTHSVATSSMCGYILGIGDRHLNNILIDKHTAEVVHIDFGIAFEQGRVLPTPETVPFRLTRDIVDGMGVSGVEGVFRRSCEKTVEVLRLHYQTIITILEVLLYDPLYDWTVSTAEANKRQKDEQDEEFNGSQSSSDEKARNVNETAERALLRLRAKLQGTESGKSSTVEHQVGTLIQQAVDPSNLSKLFYGWQPYL